MVYLQIVAKRSIKKEQTKNMKKYIIVPVLLCLSVLVVTSAALAAIIPPPTDIPTSSDQCKRDGWRNYNDMFKNQGDCVSFVVTNGKNAPDGPAIH
jgi:hypothetical protein